MEDEKFPKSEKAPRDPNELLNQFNERESALGDAVERGDLADMLKALGGVEAFRVSLSDEEKERFDKAKQEMLEQFRRDADEMIRQMWISVRRES